MTKRGLGLAALTAVIVACAAGVAFAAPPGEPVVPNVAYALKGVGERAMELLVEERDHKGSFKSLDDFAKRVDPRLLNKRPLETLAAAGGCHSKRNCPPCHSEHRLPPLFVISSAGCRSEKSARSDGSARSDFLRAK